VLMMVEPTLPVPSPAPLLTVVRLDDAIEPFTISAPWHPREHSKIVENSGNRHRVLTRCRRFPYDQNTLINASMR
jgi:hypothetical protein